LAERIRASARRRYCRFLLDQGIRELLRHPPPEADLGSLIGRLHRAWDNPIWSLGTELLSRLAEEARFVEGPILECGSGLSTLIMGAVTHGTATQVWALEHDARWAARVGDALKRHGLTSVTLVHAPLENYGEYAWYGREVVRRLPADIGMVVCDGPPGHTLGGRYGLLPLTRPMLRPGCVVLLDDLARPAEQAIFARWCDELGVKGLQEGRDRPYGRLVLSHRTPEGSFHQGNQQQAS